MLRSLRCLGEQGFVLMSQRWRTLQRVMLSPGKIGDIAQAALVLVQLEHKMITHATAGISRFRLGGRALGERAAPPSGPT